MEMERLSRHGHVAPVVWRGASPVPGFLPLVIGEVGRLVTGAPERGARTQTW